MRGSMKYFFKKHAYVWLALMLTLCALHITQSQKVEKPIAPSTPAATEAPDIQVLNTPTS